MDILLFPKFFAVGVALPPLTHIHTCMHANPSNPVSIHANPSNPACFPKHTHMHPLQPHIQMHFPSPTNTGIPIPYFPPTPEYWNVINIFCLECYQYFRGFGLILFIYLTLPLTTLRTSTITLYKHTRYGLGKLTQRKPIT